MVIHVNTIKITDFLNNITNPNYKIIDLREKEDFLKYSIPNSINIPFNTLLSKYHQYLSKEEIYFLICKKGITSLEISGMLNAKGYKTISVIGGFNAYINLTNRIKFHNYY